MSEPILSTEYWRKRLAESVERHHAIFRCDIGRWRRIEDEHRRILKETIRPDESVLDVGCGWGRLLSLMPSDWTGFYLGIDLSPEFIALARHEYPRRPFLCGDARDALECIPTGYFEWAVMISIRPMIKRNLGSLYWDELETKIKRTCRAILFLEYDEEDRGEIVTSEVSPNLGASDA